MKFEFLSKFNNLPEERKLKTIKLCHLVVAIATILFIFFSSRASFLGFLAFLFFAASVFTGILIIKQKIHINNVEYAQKKAKAEKAEADLFSEMTPEESSYQKARLDKLSDKKRREEVLRLSAMTAEERSAERKAVEKAESDAKEKAEKEAEEKIKLQEANKSNWKEFIKKQRQNINADSPASLLNDSEFETYFLVTHSLNTFLNPSSVRVIEVYSSPKKYALAMKITAQTRGGGSTSSIMTPRCSLFERTVSSEDLNYSLVDYNYASIEGYNICEVDIGKINKAINHYIKEMGWN